MLVQVGDTLKIFWTFQIIRNSWKVAASIYIFNIFDYFYPLHHFVLWMELSALQGKKVEWLPDFKQQHTYGSTYFAQWGSFFREVWFKSFFIPLRFPEVFDRFSVSHKSKNLNKSHEFIGQLKPRISEPGL